MSLESKPREESQSIKPPEPNPQPVYQNEFMNGKNKSRMTVLRLEKDESLEDGIKRLRARGWEIPDPSQLGESSDATGKYIFKK